jgi:23S rRNA (cytidine1920-2'-O)/16S rRNA (cytidine1409-2'-O)-methyltransferase
MSTRLDVWLTDTGKCDSRSRAQAYIKNGLVTVNGKTVDKPSYSVIENDVVVLNSEGTCPYVSRGGLKLKGALDAFELDPSGMVCIDIGASTGGFTDCLLKHGAKRVYAVDSGTSQLHFSLRTDERVISLENTNARYLSEKDFTEKMDLAVMDVSFISQTKLFFAVCNVLRNEGRLISLIKPQFEVGRDGIGKGGIVKDERLRKKAVEDVLAAAEAFGLKNEGLAVSPIKGGDGNVEYVACFVYKK